jgi:menaquinone-dependent protoporphyrinogen oxidase
MMKVLITAATRHGATGEIAQVIGDALRERGLDATVLEPEQVDGVDGYDAVVLGSAVYAGHWLKPARELVARCGDALATRPVWLFSSGPVGDPPTPEQDPVDVAEVLAATRAREHRVFAGKLVRKQLAFPERAIVSALRVPDGDFRDWPAITEWTGAIATALGARSRRPTAAQSRSDFLSLRMSFPGLPLPRPSDLALSLLSRCLARALPARSAGPSLPVSTVREVGGWLPVAPAATTVPRSGA